MTKYININYLLDIVNKFKLEDYSNYSKDYEDGYLDCAMAIEDIINNASDDFVTTDKYKVFSIDYVIQKIVKKCTALDKYKTLIATPNKFYTTQLMNKFRKYFADNDINEIEKVKVSRTEMFIKFKNQSYIRFVVPSDNCRGMSINELVVYDSIDIGVLSTILEPLMSDYKFDSTIDRKEPEILVYRTRNNCKYYK